MEAHRVLLQTTRAVDDMNALHTVGIDETSLQRGPHCITVVDDLVAKRLLFASEGRHRTVLDFAQDLKAHGGDPAAVRYVCRDMSAPYTNGVCMALPKAAISYDSFHDIKMAIEAMDELRRNEWREQPQAVLAAMGSADRKVFKGLRRGMRKNPLSCSSPLTNAMHWLHSTLKAARAWRLKMALREVYAAALKHKDEPGAQADLQAWLSWVRRSRLAPFKKLARTLTPHFVGVISSMVDNRSNAFVEALNGLSQQAKRAARGFLTSSNSIAIAYLRMSRRFIQKFHNSHIQNSSTHQSRCDEPRELRSLIGRSLFHQKSRIRRPEPPPRTLKRQKHLKQCFAGFRSTVKASAHQK